jgi:hypothetical protein
LLAGNSFFGNCKETKKFIGDALAILRGEQGLNLSGIALPVCGERVKHNLVPTKLLHGSPEM